MAYTTINDPALYFNTIGVGFQTALVWIHDRAVGWGATTYDAVRGTNKVLVPHDTGAEDAAETQTYGYLSAFGSDGFTVVEGTSNGRYTHYPSQTYLSFNWKAGTTSGLSGGTITPSAYSINTTSGFGIYAYTGNETAGATITHGLGIVPKLIIVKSRAATNSWEVFHVASGNGDAMQLNGTGAGDDSTAYWNDTSPTSSVFSLGDGTDTNRSGTMIGYVFAPVQGYSAMGSFEGTGNANGPFVYTGFRPAWLMIKNATAAGAAWHVYNSKIQGYNVENHFVEADAPTAEADDDNLDLLSNGFKIRRHTGHLNTDGETYAYTAFAESPFVNSNGVPNNAR